MGVFWELLSFCAAFWQETEGVVISQNEAYCHANVGGSLSFFGGVAGALEVIKAVLT
jgi:hypothetical protein